MGSTMGSNYWCLWEIYEYVVEGTEEVYGTKQKWINNTTSDLVVEIGLAVWMVI